jgi:hypothetical protein
MRNETARKLIQKANNDLIDLKQSLWILADRIQHCLACEEEEAEYRQILAVIREKEAIIRELTPLAYSQEEIAFERECREEIGREIGALHGAEAYNDYMGY